MRGMKSSRRLLTLAAGALLALSIGCTSNTAEVEKLRKELDAVKAATPAPISAAIVTVAGDTRYGSGCGVPPSEYAAAKAIYDAAYAAAVASEPNTPARLALLDAMTRVSTVAKTFLVKYTLLGQTNGYCMKPTAPCALEARVGFALPESCLTP